MFIVFTVYLIYDNTYNRISSKYCGCDLNVGYKKVILITIMCV